MQATGRHILIGVAVCGATLASIALLSGRPAAAPTPKPPTPFKEAKLIIEHNATDNDIGFQGFIDSEGWQLVEVNGPKGPVLRLEGLGALGRLGVTELFFETVEPANDEIATNKVLEMLPAGRYSFKGRGMTAGEATGESSGGVTLTHDVPAGAPLLAPAKDAVVPADELVMRWGAVTKTIRGTPVNVIAYQLIVEKDVEPHPRMLGKWGLSMVLPASVTSMTLPRGFLEPASPYRWEVLAIEESGNQTLTTANFKTQ